MINHKPFRLLQTVKNGVGKKSAPFTFNLLQNLTWQGLEILQRQFRMMLIKSHLGN